MRTFNKSLLIGGVIGTVGLGTLAGTGIVSAQSANPQESLIDKIAARFNIDKDEVKKVFDEEHEARAAEHEKSVATRLQKLLDDKTITADQKAVIEKKLTDLKAERDANKGSLKDLSPTERRAKMEERRAELEAWAKQHNLDLTQLRGIFMGGHGHGHREHGGPEQTPPTE